ncbi:MAG: FAD:protein FMN transferase [Gammaproteobacteria bacterium]|nr:FAD:protein FMN transferase [Gammaproteobacteria bacterium]
MNLTLKRFSFQAMGSYCEIQIYDESRINAKNNARRLTSEISRIERKYSSARQQNFLSEINYSSGNKLGIKIDTETKALFDHALDCFEKSEGLIDITAGELSKLWDFENQKTATIAETEAILPYIGLHKLKWRKSRLYLPPEMTVDFGSIIKEYAADTAAKIAKHHGVKHGLVNLGGDFAVIGPQPNDQPWTVGIANPKSPNSLLAKIDVLEGGVATIGDYSNSFIFEGKHFTPVLNPKTGLPCNGLRAASVLSDGCANAGSLAKAAILLKEQQGLELLESAEVTFAAMDSAGKIQGSGVHVN